ncbi:bifunctional NAD(P)/FAD-dependent oxidoreductase/class I SAM-dependent methyltransferase [Actinomycetospora sp. NBRC 106378]|uniref:bifunctional NAD(P)/FAD-dependent oxidoreductase/class I SAM-dependent methyltransferase n=1 Tax=Actinomycetospora sp. NBRC 106378 TaxID=3032208 RepID=UPI0024A0BC0C|nr:bifunctional NAD(P)/FAD-dependent oxidoreductase/class I SAM-dependent methyltransferase [Actinomycetospora sp. NBRC 106378]GLZ52208.1 methyltransferase [Actinomycetospora sp. NBRC 106378]
MTENWDVIVVGGGAAGLAAGLTLARSRRRVLVVDAGEPRNAPAAHMHNYLGREGASPADLLADGRVEVESYGGVVRQGTVTDAGPSDAGGFDLSLHDGSTHHARRVVLATGVVDELPDVEGLAQRWGQDVLHCPYCHGWEVRDRRIGVLATSPLALHQVQLFRQWSDDVVLFTNDALDLDRHASDELTARGIEVVGGKATRLVVGNTGLEAVELADGSRIAVDALAIATVVHARGEVATMLGLPLVEMTMGDVVVGNLVESDEQGRTAVPGVWAAGNVTDLRATVIVASAQGTAAAAAVNADLVAEDVRLALHASRDGSPEFWERFYAEREQVWSGRVNAALEATAAPLAPGTALDLGAGEGGDALWLAGRGWRVTATDVSQTACDRIAARAGDLALTTERHDLTETFPDGEFDLVTASFLHSPHADFPRTAILRRAAAAVAPGGTLLVLGHGRLTPWSWDPSLRLPTADEVLASLELGEEWEVVRVASPERVATGPDGQEATITDEIVVVRRRP